MRTEEKRKNNNLRRRKYNSSHKNKQKEVIVEITSTKMIIMSTIMMITILHQNLKIDNLIMIQIPIKKGKKDLLAQLIEINHNINKSIIITIKN